MSWLQSISNSFTPLETRWGLYQSLSLPEETTFQSGGDNAVFRKEGVHHGSMDFSGMGELAVFLCLKYLWHLYDLWHMCLFYSPVFCIEYWFCNAKFVGVSEWAARTLCPSADRKYWEAGLFVSLMVYKIQMLVDGQLQENFHLKQSSEKMYLNPQNGDLSVLSIEESQWLQSVKCCSAYLGSGRNIYH